MTHFTIGILSKRSGVNVETIRYYERRGIMPEPPRAGSGFRQYSMEDLNRLNFIRRAKGLGFSLREVSELLFLRVDPKTTCRDVKERAKIKINEIDNRINALKVMKKVLVELADSCTGSGSKSECPILEMLNSKKGWR